MGTCRGQWPRPPWRSDPPSLGSETPQGSTLGRGRWRWLTSEEERDRGKSATDPESDRSPHFTQEATEAQRGRDPPRPLRCQIWVGLYPEPWAPSLLLPPRAPLAIHSYQTSLRRSQKEDSQGESKDQEN